MKNLPFILIFFLISCSSKKQTPEFQVLNTPFKEGTGFELSSLIAEMEIIPLNGDFLLGDVSEINFIEDNLIVLDKRLQNVKIFDENFNYSSTIDNLGAGPGEYQKADDLFTSGNDFIIYSNPQASLLSYDLTGQFKGQQKFGGYPYSVAHLNDHLVTYQNFNKAKKIDFNLKSWNKGELIAGQFEINKSFKPLIVYSGGLAKVIQEKEDRISYNPPLSDTIYILDKRLNLEKTYTLSGLLKNPVDLKGETQIHYDPRKPDKSYFRPLTTTANGYSWIQYMEQKRAKFAFLDFNKSEFYRIDRGNKDNLYISSLLFDIRAYHDGYFYSVPNRLYLGSFNHILIKLLEEKNLNQKIIESEDFKFLFRFKWND